MPTAPSKRPNSDRIPRNSSENAGMDNAFLPKEPGIIEKEEAAAFKTFIQLAITNFAGSDSISTPSRISSHLRPTKSNRSITVKDKNIVKKSAIATPRNLMGAAVNRGNVQEAIKLPPVYSGFVLSPCRTDAREAILNAGNGLFSSGAKLELATNWTPVITPTLPKSIKKLEGQIQVKSSMLSDEIERVCTIRPAHVKFYSRNKEEIPHRTRMAYFTKAPRSGFRAFDESGIAKVFKKQQPLGFVQDAMAITPQRIAPEHYYVKTTTRLITQKLYAWQQKIAEIVEVHIAQTDGNFLLVQLV
ncbi:hypothetical protein EPUL_004397 [Erysiphe pulchra]|uniref:Uncharacterized protein n=1 Tax=Erysiphe pulchra TaxID=225359 RepID=A0A2S4PUT6_9PEZI|nr:hypothetical protein EPUL_004397 [Erysiphe pulchra]